MSSKNRTTVYASLATAVAEELERVAKRDGRTMSATVQMAVECYLGMRDKQGHVARWSHPDGVMFQRIPLVKWKDNTTRRNDGGKARVRKQSAQ